MTTIRDEQRKKYRKATEILAQSYGVPEWHEPYDPVSQLVNTILSQQTNSANRQQAYDRLQARFPHWETVMAAPVGEVQEAIKPAGLSNQKAPRIQNALRYIERERGELSLDFLQDMEVDDAKAWLTEIKGVGPKTAAIILLFVFHMPAFPVDTHVHRVTQRLGIINDVSAGKAHTLLEEIVVEDDYYPFHINLIKHGREVCMARNPRCAICPLQDLCDYYQQR